MDNHWKVGRAVMGNDELKLKNWYQPDPTPAEVRALFGAGMDTVDIAQFWYGLKALEYRIANILAQAKSERVAA